ncbi:hypothetical protein ACFLX5_01500 [Chloroflexota bacterium]
MPTEMVWFDRQKPVSRKTKETVSTPYNEFLFEPPEYKGDTITFLPTSEQRAIRKSSGHPSNAHVNVSNMTRRIGFVPLIQRGIIAHFDQFPQANADKFIGTYQRGVQHRYISSTSGPIPAGKVISLSPQYKKGMTNIAHRHPNSFQIGLDKTKSQAAANQGMVISGKTESDYPHGSTPETRQQKALRGLMHKAEPPFIYAQSGAGEHHDAVAMTPLPAGSQRFPINTSVVGRVASRVLGFIKQAKSTTISSTISDRPSLINPPVNPTESTKDMAIGSYPVHAVEGISAANGQQSLENQQHIKNTIAQRTFRSQPALEERPSIRSIARKPLELIRQLRNGSGFSIAIMERVFSNRALSHKDKAHLLTSGYLPLKKSPQTSGTRRESIQRESTEATGEGAYGKISEEYRTPYDAALPVADKTLPMMPDTRSAERERGDIQQVPERATIKGFTKSIARKYWPLGKTVSPVTVEQTPVGKRYPQVVPTTMSRILQHKEMITKEPANAFIGRDWPDKRIMRSENDGYVPSNKINQLVQLQEVQTNDNQQTASSRSLAKILRERYKTVKSKSVSHSIPLGSIPLVQPLLLRYADQRDATYTPETSDLWTADENLDTRYLGGGTHIGTVQQDVTHVQPTMQQGINRVSRRKSSAGKISMGFSGKNMDTKLPPLYVSQHRVNPESIQRRYESVELEFAAYRKTPHSSELLSDVRRDIDYSPAISNTISRTTQPWMSEKLKGDGPDTEAIAQQVYKIIRGRLSVEKERAGFR